MGRERHESVIGEHMLLADTILNSGSTHASILKWLSENIDEYIHLSGVDAFNEKKYSDTALNSMSLDVMTHTCEIFNGAYKNIISTNDYDIAFPCDFFCEKFISHVSRSILISKSNGRPLVEFLSTDVNNTSVLFLSNSNLLCNDESGANEIGYMDAWCNVFLRDLVEQEALEEIVKCLFEKIESDFSLMLNAGASGSDSPSMMKLVALVNLSSLNANCKSVLLSSIETQISKLNDPSLAFYVNSEFSLKMKSADFSFERYQEDCNSEAQKKIKGIDRIQYMLDAYISRNLDGYSLFDDSSEKLSKLIDSVVFSDESILDKSQADAILGFALDSTETKFVNLLPWVIMSGKYDMNLLEVRLNELDFAYGSTRSPFTGNLVVIEAIEKALCCETRWSDEFLRKRCDDNGSWLYMLLPGLIDSASATSMDTLNYIFTKAINEPDAYGVHSKIAESALQKKCSKYIYPDILSGANIDDEIMCDVLVDGAELDILTELDISLISKTNKIKVYVNNAGDRLNKIAQTSSGVQEALTAAILSEMTKSCNLKGMTPAMERPSIRI